jgi:hypothetical protein
MKRRISAVGFVIVSLNSSIRILEGMTPSSLLAIPDHREGA